MIFWGEVDGVPLDRDRFIKISNIVESQKPTMERDSKVSEKYRLVRVTIWGDIDSLLMSCDCFLKTADVAKTLIPTSEGHSEVI